MPNSIFFASLEIAKHLLNVEHQKVVIFRMKFLNLVHCGSAKTCCTNIPCFVLESVYFYICRGFLLQFQNLFQISWCKMSCKIDISRMDSLWYCILALLLSKVTFSWMLLTLALSLSMSVCSLVIVVLSSFSLSLAKTSSRVH